MNLQEEILQLPKKQTPQIFYLANQHLTNKRLSYRPILQENHFFTFKYIFLAGKNFSEMK